MWSVPVEAQMLLFSAKKETPDMWRALAARFRRAIGFALVSFKIPAI
jgi:hypothetical protein